MLTLLALSLVTTSSIVGLPAAAHRGHDHADDQERPITRLAFGSCARERDDQPIWFEILKTDPQLFLFIGDNQYADLWEKDGEIVMAPVPNPERIAEAYDELASKPGYQAMTQHCPVLATWDDHDYGANDAGNDFVFRDESQDLFIDFYGFADDAPIRDQEGIYQSYTYGPEGKQLQVILLDTRYHRDALDAGERGPNTGPYVPTDDTSRSMLGEAQWEWLEEQLNKPADLRLIASSIQVVADEHRWETWGNMPHERQRLYDLIDETNASGVFFISGDRHLMELSRDNGRGDEMPVPYPMYDFTSSGLTQSASPVEELNTYRVGPVYRQTNFGVIEIEWGGDGREPAVHLVGLGGSADELLLRQTVFMSELAEN